MIMPEYLKLTRYHVTADEGYVKEFKELLGRNLTTEEIDSITISNGTATLEIRSMRKK